MHRTVGSMSYHSGVPHRLTMRQQQSDQPTLQVAEDRSRNPYTMVNPGSIRGHGFNGMMNDRFRHAFSQASERPFERPPPGVLGRRPPSGVLGGKPPLMAMRRGLAPDRIPQASEPRPPGASGPGSADRLGGMDRGGKPDTCFYQPPPMSANIDATASDPMAMRRGLAPERSPFVQMNRAGMIGNGFTPPPPMGTGLNTKTKDEMAMMRGLASERALERMDGRPRSQLEEIKGEGMSGTCYYQPPPMAASDGLDMRMPPASEMISGGMEGRSNNPYGEINGDGMTGQCFYQPAPMADMYSAFGNPEAYPTDSTPPMADMYSAWGNPEAYPTDNKPPMADMYSAWGNPEAYPTDSTKDVHDNGFYEKSMQMREEATALSDPMVINKGARGSTNDQSACPGKKVKKKKKKDKPPRSAGKEVSSQNDSTKNIDKPKAESICDRSFYEVFLQKPELDSKIQKSLSKDALAIQKGYATMKRAPLFSQNGSTENIDKPKEEKICDRSFYEVFLQKPELDSKMDKKSLSKDALAIQKGFATMKRAPFVSSYKNLITEEDTTNTNDAEEGIYEKINQRKTPERSMQEANAPIERKSANDFDRVKSIAEEFAEIKNMAEADYKNIAAKFGIELDTLSNEASDEPMGIGDYKDNLFGMSAKVDTAVNDSLSLEPTKKEVEQSKQTDINAAEKENKIKEVETATMRQLETKSCFGTNLQTSTSDNKTAVRSELRQKSELRQVSALETKSCIGTNLQNSTPDDKTAVKSELRQVLALETKSCIGTDLQNSTPDDKTAVKSEFRQVSINGNDLSTPARNAVNSRLCEQTCNTSIEKDAAGNYPQQEDTPRVTAQQEDTPRVTAQQEDTPRVTVPEVLPKHLHKSPNAAAGQTDHLHKSPNAAAGQTDHLHKSPNAAAGQTDHLHKSPNAAAGQTIHLHKSPNAAAGQTDHQHKSPNAAAGQTDHLHKSPNAAAGQTDHLHKSPNAAAGQTDHLHKSPNAAAGQTDHLHKSPNAAAGQTDHLHKSPNAGAGQTDHLATGDGNLQPKLDTDEDAKTCQQPSHTKEETSASINDQVAEEINSGYKHRDVPFKANTHRAEFEGSKQIPTPPTSNGFEDTGCRSETNVTKRVDSKGITNTQQHDKEEDTSIGDGTEHIHAIQDERYMYKPCNKIGQNSMPIQSTAFAEKTGLLNAAAERVRLQTAKHAQEIMEGNHDEARKYIQRPPTSGLAQSRSFHKPRVKMSTGYESKKDVAAQHGQPTALKFNICMDGPDNERRRHMQSNETTNNTPESTRGLSKNVEYGRNRKMAISTTDIRTGISKEDFDEAVELEKTHKVLISTIETITAVLQNWNEKNDTCENHTAAIKLLIEKKLKVLMTTMETLPGILQEGLNVSRDASVKYMKKNENTLKLLMSKMAKQTDILQEGLNDRSDASEKYMKKNENTLKGLVSKMATQYDIFQEGLDDQIDAAEKYMHTAKLLMQKIARRIDILHEDLNERSDASEKYMKKSENTLKVLMSKMAIQTDIFQEGLNDQRDASEKYMKKIENTLKVLMSTMETLPDILQQTLNEKNDTHANDTQRRETVEFENTVKALMSTMITMAQLLQQILNEKKDTRENHTQLKETVEYENILKVLMEKENTCKAFLSTMGKLTDILQQNLNEKKELCENHSRNGYENTLKVVMSTMATQTDMLNEVLNELRDASERHVDKSAKPSQIRQDSNPEQSHNVFENKVESKRKQYRKTKNVGVSFGSQTIDSMDKDVLACSSKSRSVHTKKSGPDDGNNRNIKTRIIVKNARSIKDDTDSYRYDISSKNEVENKEKKHRKTTKDIGISAGAQHSRISQPFVSIQNSRNETDVSKYAESVSKNGSDIKEYSESVNRHQHTKNEKGECRMCSVYIASVDACDARWNRHTERPWHVAQQNGVPLNQYCILEDQYSGENIFKNLKLDLPVGTNQTYRSTKTSSELNDDLELEMRQQDRRDTYRVGTPHIPDDDDDDEEDTGCCGCCPRKKNQSANKNNSNGNGVPRRNLVMRFLRQLKARFTR